VSDYGSGVWGVIYGLGEVLMVVVIWEWVRFGSSLVNRKSDVQITRKKRRCR